VKKLDFYLFSPVPLTRVFQHLAKESITVLTLGRTKGRNVSAPLLAPPISF